ncbi:hypothetical protein TL16_g07841 [Triparma laevis f. inornata]|uniref:protein-tyrosine-phosphatase n=1 Tax=Triparma laevis f. inornata TaxID=1714386 RepID=A0A9W7EIW9_9STRA|nr:hypothetical protein TL16_g07841 [Triparma laevis f. inornata]
MSSTLPPPPASSTTTTTTPPPASTDPPATTTARIGSKPTLVSRSGLTFLIMDCPRPQNLHLYIKELKKHNVTDIVRVCSPTYSPTDLESAGVKLWDMAYDDGTSPPEEVIDSWLKLVKDRMITTKPASAIAVHCVAGLGRAPVLVALALIEFGGLDPIVAVDFIRKNRRGAINNKQLLYLERYERRMGGGGCGCVVM